MSAALDAVLFDLDGVLCDSEPFIAEAAAEMLRRRYGIPATPADFLPFLGAGDDRFIAGGGEAHGVTVDPEADKAATYAIYLERIRTRLQPIPGVQAFLADLRAAGMRLALATGSDRPKLEGNLAAIGIPETTFDTVVSAEQVTRRKPDPETFLLAAARLGVTPERCLVVEDARHGVVAGRAAGCRVLGITSTLSAPVLLEAGALAAVPDYEHLSTDVLALLGIA